MTARHYPFLDLKTVNAPFDEQIRQAVMRVMDSGRYIGGVENTRFEEALARSCGASYCVGTANGLDALRLILRGCIELGRMKPGDEIIVPANTYIATVLAVSDCGLTPVFAEPDPRTLNIDTARLADYVTPRTRAILTVHLYGRICYDSAMQKVADDNGLLIIEDNAQAIGASLAGMDKRSGALGYAAAFSFYPTKNIGALGDAGAVTTDDAALADAVRALGNYGSDRRYHNIYRGVNSRLDPMQAAILGEKLPFVDRENAIRRENAAVYEREITNPAVIKPLYTNDNSCVWHQYVVLTDDRDGFRRHMSDHGVETDINYPLSPFDQPCYTEEYNPDCPIARRLARTVVSLPVSRCTSASDAARIAAIVNSYVLAKQ